MGARQYDAVTGRFLSVDPVLDTTDPQQTLAYLYANNNPVTFSDPTGLQYMDHGPGNDTSEDDWANDCYPGSAGCNDMPDDDAWANDCYPGSAECNDYTGPSTSNDPDDWQSANPTSSGKKDGGGIGSWWRDVKRKTQEKVADANARVARAAEWAWNTVSSVNWVEVASWVSTGLSVAALFGCAVCAGGAPGISLGVAIYKFTNSKKEKPMESGWWDLAGAVSFGAAKAVPRVAKAWRSGGHKVVGTLYPDGGAPAVARANKVARSRGASIVKSVGRKIDKVGAGASGWDQLYGAYGLATFGTQKLLAMPSLSEM